MQTEDGIQSYYEEGGLELKTARQRNRAINALAWLATFTTDNESVRSMASRQRHRTPLIDTGPVRTQ